MAVFDNEETHPSFGVAGFSRVSVSGGGIQLFDSSVPHQHYIELHIATAKRQRGLHRDWIHGINDDEIVRIALSEAQFGALISTFNQGDGVPVTITRRDGALVPAGPHESRLAVTAREVANAADKATTTAQEATAALAEAIRNKKGAKAVSEALGWLEATMKNLPANMEFAAKSMTEHTEKVVTKAKADIEAMVQAAAAQAGLQISTPVHEILELEA